MLVAPSRSSKITDNYLLDNGHYGIAIEHGSLDNDIDSNDVAGDSLTTSRTPTLFCPISKTLSESWSENTGTRNQKGSGTCIG